jgi:hypothetical protein
MSSKLVKKLLQQTNRALDTTNGESAKEVQSRKRRVSAKASPREAMTKEEILQSHVQSILRLDHKIQTSASTVAQKSFARHSSQVRKQQKAVSNSKKTAAGVSNSRSSTSNFAQKKHEPTYDKVKAKQQREEAYYEGVAKALRKAKKRKMS